MFLLKIIKQLNAFNIPYAIVGGHAVALHGAVRGTVDIDFITKWQLTHLKNIEKAMKALSLTSLLPITAEDLFNNKETYIKEKNLIAWHFVNHNNPLEQIDIIITYDLEDESVDTINVQNMSINILSKESLIKMKRESGRVQDLIDVEALEKLMGETK